MNRDRSSLNVVIHNPNTTTILCTGAYGRSYTTVEACLKDWNDGKDFQISGGPYFSIRDSEKIKADNWAMVLRIVGQWIVLVQPEARPLTLSEQLFG